MNLRDRIGGNLGPALEASLEPIELTLDMVQLAEHSRVIIAYAMKKQNPAMVAMKRQGGEKLAARKVWFAVLTRLRQFTQAQLAEITGLYRGTVADDVAEVERWAKANGLIAETLEMLEEHVAPLPGIVANGADFTTDCMAEHEAEIAARKAIERVRAAADRLEREEAEDELRALAQTAKARGARFKAVLDQELAASLPAPKPEKPVAQQPYDPTSERRREAEAIQREGVERQRREREALHARIAARVAEEAQKRKPSASAG